MSDIYWYNESSKGDELCISLIVNSKKIVDIGEYYLFLGEFIKTYEDRIFSASKIDELDDGTLKCTIHIKGRETIIFRNKMY